MRWASAIKSWFIYSFYFKLWQLNVSLEEMCLWYAIWSWEKRLEGIGCRQGSQRTGNKKETEYEGERDTEKVGEREDQSLCGRLKPKVSELMKEEVCPNLVNLLKTIRLYFHQVNFMVYKLCLHKALKKETIGVFGTQFQVAWNPTVAEEFPNASAQFRRAH